MRPQWHRIFAWSVAHLAPFISFSLLAEDVPHFPIEVRCVSTAVIGTVAADSDYDWDQKILYLELSICASAGIKSGTYDIGFIQTRVQKVGLSPEFASNRGGHIVDDCLVYHESIHAVDDHPNTSLADSDQMIRSEVKAYKAQNSCLKTYRKSYCGNPDPAIKVECAKIEKSIWHTSVGATFNDCLHSVLNKIDQAQSHSVTKKTESQSQHWNEVIECASTAADACPDRISDNECHAYVQKMINTYSPEAFRNGNYTPPPSEKRCTPAPPLTTTDFLAVDIFNLFGAASKAQ